MEPTETPPEPEATGPTTEKKYCWWVYLPILGDPFVIARCELVAWQETRVLIRGEKGISIVHNPSLPIRGRGMFKTFRQAAIFVADQLRDQMVSIYEHGRQLEAAITRVELLTEEQVLCESAKA